MIVIFSPTIPNNHFEKKLKINAKTDKPTIIKQYLLTSDLNIYGSNIYVIMANRFLIIKTPNAGPNIPVSIFKLKAIIELSMGLL